jgi:hypothetical protein
MTGPLWYTNGGEQLPQTPFSPASLSMAEAVLPAWS